MAGSLSHQLTTNTSIYGPATTDMAHCMAVQQVGPNENEETRIFDCSTPLTTTTNQYVEVFPAETIEYITGKASGVITTKIETIVSLASQRLHMRRANQRF